MTRNLYSGSEKDSRIFWLGGPWRTERARFYLSLALSQDWAVQYWLSHGTPRKKLLLVLALYGQSFTLKDSRNHSIGSVSTSSGRAGFYTRTGGRLSYFEVESPPQKKKKKKKKIEAHLFGFKSKQWPLVNVKLSDMWLIASRLGESVGRWAERILCLQGKPVGQLRWWTQHCFQGEIIPEIYRYTYRCFKRIRIPCKWQLILMFLSLGKEACCCWLRLSGQTMDAPSSKIYAYVVKQRWLLLNMLSLLHPTYVSWWQLWSGGTLPHLSSSASCPTAVGYAFVLR